ncbi:hypothetical protein C0J52_21484, partial [Blattella germanica]
SDINLLYVYCILVIINVLQITELDGSLDLSRQEMNRMRSRGDEAEERCRAREQELLARLGGAEGRLRALEAQLLQLEAAKKEVEHKLSSVGSTLRRIAGIQLDGSVTLPYKLMSPSRRWSPAKSKSSTYLYIPSTIFNFLYCLKVDCVTHIRIRGGAVLMKSANS